jgi:hypothetical protein
MEMKIRIVERRGFLVVLWLHTANDIQQAEWDDACGTIAALKAKTPGVLGRLRMLVVSDGGAPNMKQRAQLFTGILQAAPVKSAAITTSLSNPVKRGIVKALTWTNAAFLAVGPGQWKEALAHVDLPGDGAIFEELAPLQAELGREVETLALVRRAAAAA